MLRSPIYRTSLDDYAGKWAEFLQLRREDGILEVRLHSDGGPCRWGLEIHRALIPAFADIHHDPDNECVILTGTGDSFLALQDDDSWTRHGFRGQFTNQQGYDIFYADQTKEPFALLNLEIPVIAAINGPLQLHHELALVSDIVLCSDDSTFSDGHFASWGIVPGDGVHILFRELLGHNRGRYFLYTGQTIDARQALDLGLVGEVVPRDLLLERAWELARSLFMSKNRVQRRLTRSLFIQPWREMFMKELAVGMAFESWACHDYWPMSDSGTEPV